MTQLLSQTTQIPNHPTKKALLSVGGKKVVGVHYCDPHVIVIDCTHTWRLEDIISLAIHEWLHHTDPLASEEVVKKATALVFAKIAKGEVKFGDAKCGV